MENDVITGLNGDRGEGGDGPSSGIEAAAATPSGGSPRLREASDPSMVEGGEEVLRLSGT